MSEVYPNSCACHLRISALKAENEELNTEKRNLESVNRCQQNDLMRFSNGLAAKAGRKAIADLENKVAAKEAEIRQGIGEWAACNSALADMTSQVASLQAKLSLYTSWQPSDPGTKEAMEWFREPGPFEADAHGRVLAHALRAAMVRLEEAEKGRVPDGNYEVMMGLHRDLDSARSRIRQLEAACILGDAAIEVARGGIIKENEVLLPYLEMKSRAEAAEIDAAHEHALNMASGLPGGDFAEEFSRAQREQRRAEAAESRVAALTAAMVRLEEAEKRDEFHVSQCAFLAARDLAVAEKATGPWREALTRECVHCVHENWVPRIANGDANFNATPPPSPTAAPAAPEKL